MKAEATTSDAHGHEIVEVTQGTNGYPKNLKKAVTGFDSFAEAEEFADLYDGEVIEIAKKYGWQLWENRHRRYEAYTPTEIAGRMPDDCYIQDTVDDHIDDDQAQAIKEKPDGHSCLHDAHGFVQYLEDEEMAFCHDTWTYQIAVI